MLIGHVTKLIEETNFILNENSFDNPSGWSKSNRATSASRCHSFRISCFSSTAALHWRNVDHDDDELSSCWCRANDTARRKRNKPPSRFLAYSANWRLLTLTRIVYYNYVLQYRVNKASVRKYTKSLVNATFGSEKKIMYQFIHNQVKYALAHEFLFHSMY